MPQKTLSLKDIMDRCNIVKLEDGVAVAPAGIGLGRTGSDQNGNLLVIRAATEDAARENLKETLKNAIEEKKLRILLVAPKEILHAGTPGQSDYYVNEWTKLQERNGEYVYDSPDHMSVYNGLPVSLG